MNLYQPLTKAIIELFGCAASGAAVLRCGGFDRVDQKRIAAEARCQCAIMFAEAKEEAERQQLDNIQYEQLVIAGTCVRVLKIIGVKVSVEEHV